MIKNNNNNIRKSLVQPKFALAANALHNVCVSNRNTFRLLLTVLRNIGPLTEKLWSASFILVSGTMIR